MLLGKEATIRRMDELGAAHIPFFFFTDFLGSKAWVKPHAELEPDELEFAFGQPRPVNLSPAFQFSKAPISFTEFLAPYHQVVDQINLGNSFLVNLTFQTPIRTDLSLRQIYQLSNARYKMRFRDEFVVFSPETFVRIADGVISAYPMKGTIDASVENAEAVILQDTKETAEHVTIVDLIRNDLSLVADKVEVSQFRFITKVKTHEKNLLQVSSEIRGQVRPELIRRFGTLIFQLLPAGSISGAPKPSTVQIIQQAENYERGFYTGVCGHFDGQNLDTGVMIRFIEKQGEQLYYKSGGGITSFSQADKEYQEIIDKVYLAV